MENRSMPREIKAKVFIVDDAPDTREIIQKLLNYEGYEVINASTGEEGVKRAEQEKPEIILMDINLPGMDGAEALKKIREVNPIQCVIMLTGLCHTGQRYPGPEGRGFGLHQETL